MTFIIYRRQVKDVWLVIIFAFRNYALCLGPSAISLEEQRLMQSLDRLNERLRGNNSYCIVLI